MRSINARIPQHLVEYLENLGESSLTAALCRVITEHQRQQFKADIESGLEFLSNTISLIKFKHSDS